MFIRGYQSLQEQWHADYCVVAPTYWIFQLEVTHIFWRSQWHQVKGCKFLPESPSSRLGNASNHPTFVPELQEVTLQGAFQGCFTNPVDLRGIKISQCEKFLRRPCNHLERVTVLRPLLASIPGYGAHQQPRSSSHHLR